LKQLVISIYLSLLTSYVYAAPKPGDFLTSGPTTEKIFALTFDDGPGPQTTAFLDLLDKYKARATFFMLGEQANNRPKVAKDVADRGHEIASHTYSHLHYGKKLKELGGDVNKAKVLLLSDMKKTNDILLKNTGKKPLLCRMPHGIDRPWIKESAKDAGLILVNWTYGSDWTAESMEKLTEEYVAAIKPGAILLLHDGNPRREKSLALTEAILKAAQEKGFRPVTVGELLNLK